MRKIPDPTQGTFIRMIFFFKCPCFQTFSFSDILLRRRWPELLVGVVRELSCDKEEPEAHAVTSYDSSQPGNRQVIADKTHQGEAVFYYALKLCVSASLIVLISEIAKRSTGFAALIASLPLTSLLAFVWLGVEGAQPEKIAELSGQIFWLIVPSLVLFPLFSMLLRMGVNIWGSLAMASAATVVAYLALLPLLRKFGLVD